MPLDVLIIEDDEDLARLIARYLLPVAHTPIIARRMDDALKLIESTPAIDLLTLDLTLPDSTRDESLARIQEFKKGHPDCLVIVVTGSMRPEEEAKAIAAGADGFMHKATTCREQESFLSTLKDIFRSIARLPERFQKNIPLLEQLTAKVCAASDALCETVKPENPSTTP